jgi:hypothetical protein
MSESYRRLQENCIMKLHNFYSQMKAVDRRLHVSCMGEERNKIFVKKM